jgi:beta-lactamase regulating signal transducer with metallopeptidase domain
MGLGTSIFLIALGAILKFAVTATVSGIELATVGTILIVIGIVGLVISLIFMMQAGRGAVVARERVVERDPYVDPRI